MARRVLRKPRACPSDTVCCVCNCWPLLLFAQGRACGPQANQEYRLASLLRLCGRSHGAPSGAPPGPFRYPSPPPFPGHTGIAQRTIVRPSPPGPQVPRRVSEARWVRPFRHTGPGPRTTVPRRHYVFLDKPECRQTPRAAAVCPPVVRTPLPVAQLPSPGGDPGNNQHISIRQLLGAADAQTAHPATSSTAPAHQLLGSANAETTPARAPAAAADRKQRPDATCEGKNG